MKITVIGTGYVGLVTGACFAHIGLDVTCADIDAAKIEALNAGRIPIYEPELDEVVAGARKHGRLHFTTDVPAAVAAADVVFIAVGTPSMADGRPDLTAIVAVARTIAPALNPGAIVVVKSTVPVGTGAYVARVIRETAPGARFSMASNPEFLREGNAVQDFLAPDRIVVGADDTHARDAMGKIYAPFDQAGVPVVLTNIATAELIKYAANAFLAAKVAFINEMANLCEAVGADVDHLSRALGLDARIGPAFLKPGPGYGGSCFPKDTLALTALAHEADCPVRIVEAVISSNTYHVRRLVSRIEADYSAVWTRRGQDDAKLSGKTIALLGLAFKSNTDDIRSAASLVIVPHLLRRGARIKAYDPAAMDNARAAMPDIDYCASEAEALAGADAALLLTEWQQFRDLDWGALAPTMATPVLFDLRNLYAPEAMGECGMSYFSLGRPAVMAKEVLSAR